MRIGLIPINMFGCGYYRMFIPFRKLEEKYNDFKMSATFTKHLNAIEDKEKANLADFVSSNDVIVIQRRYGHDWEEYAKSLLKMGKRVIYEIDDCFEGIPLENLKLNAVHMTNSETRHSVVRMMRIADLVTVSTPELEYWVSKYASLDKVVVLKNTLDFSMWPEPHYGKPIPGEPLVVGFAGSETHKTDLRALGSALEMVNDKINLSKKSTIVRFGFFGFMLREYWKMDPHVAFKLGVPFLDYPKVLSDLGFQLGLAPLKECLFNECKSELRFLEHAVCGVPVVATNIAPFRRCINEERGILVKNKDRQWKSAIIELISNKSKRERLGRNSYNYVNEYYNIETYVKEWYNVYSQL